MTQPDYRARTDDISGMRFAITGGTGTFGRAMTKRLLDNGAELVTVISRDEVKQSEMRADFPDDRLVFELGDIRDAGRMVELIGTAPPDYRPYDAVIHAAALKRVDVLEHNPYEAIRTNIDGTRNILQACGYGSLAPKHLLLITTDKAVQPVNLYGATKMLAERTLMTSLVNHLPRCSVVRFGNVLGSRGSVLPKFVELAKTGQPIPVTDPAMTRFWITQDEAVDIALFAINTRAKQEAASVFVPLLKSMQLGAMLDALGVRNTKLVGERPGEKTDEVLISGQEMRTMLMVQHTELPIIQIIHQGEVASDGGSNWKRRPNVDEEYSSADAPKWSADEMREVVKSMGLMPVE